MYPLYNILIITASILLFPFFILMLLLRPKYRKGLSQKLGFLPSGLFKTLEGKEPIWIHAVSVGEVMAALPLVRELKKRYADLGLVISTVTDTGNFTAREQVKEADCVIFFPFDYPLIVRRVIKRVKPQLFITLETEIWPNFLRELNRLEIPAIMVSGRISAHSFRHYRFFSFFFRKVLKNFSFFCMQSEIDAERIVAIGAPPEKLKVTGNLKLNQNIPIRIPEDKEALFTTLHLQDGKKIFIAGSTHRGEEEIVLKVFKELKKEFYDLVLLLAPRHPERFEEVASLIEDMGFKLVRRTQIDSIEAKDKEVILLDTIGELFKFYSIGTVIFIGGSLVPVGGHNILEPAIYKKAVLFGPYMDNFPEISQILLNKGAGICVRDEKEFIERARVLLLNEDLRESLGEKALKVIEDNQGVLTRNMEVIQEFLNHL